MINSIKSIVDYSGVDSIVVGVECHITNGLPSIIIIGYASKTVDEARERLRASFSNCQLPFPKKRVTLNLSPADVPKDSTSLDLAMAISVLAQSKQIEFSKTEGWMFLGELGLDGSLNALRGMIGRVLEAKKLGFNKFYIPVANLDQALLIPGVEIKAAGSLKDVYLDLIGVVPLKTLTGSGHRISEQMPKDLYLDFSEISGQPIAKRALEIAAAGHHNILLHGPPGTGKTMLAKAICGILPDLHLNEVLEVTHLHSVATGHNGIITKRPFRSPHHTTSTTALIGGGTKPKPGEASLAHRGILFLDEIPEFSHSSLEALRQPLEDREVTVARVRSTATYPANFILVATQNPCPCGYYGTLKPCKCSASAIAKYQQKVSGPILDRIDLHLSVNDIDNSKILARRDLLPESPAIKIRIEKAYSSQHKRLGDTRFNSSLSNKEIRETAELASEAKDILDLAADKLSISARAYIRTVRVARTIADLDQELTILPRHITEALQYRQQVYA